MGDLRREEKQRATEAIPPCGACGAAGETLRGGPYQPHLDGGRVACLDGVACLNRQDGGSRASDTGDDGEAGFYRKGGSRVGVTEPNASPSSRASGSNSYETARGALAWRVLGMHEANGGYFLPSHDEWGELVRLARMAKGENDDDQNSGGVRRVQENDSAGHDDGADERVRGESSGSGQRLEAGGDVLPRRRIVPSVREGAGSVVEAVPAGRAAEEVSSSSSSLSWGDTARAIGVRVPFGSRMPPPEVAPAAAGELEGWTVNGRPIEIDEDDPDAQGWTVAGRPVAARDIDHGPEAEGWSVNGAPIPVPGRVDHARCRANLDAERARLRKAIGLLVDMRSPARRAIAFLDEEERHG